MKKRQHTGRAASLVIVMLLAAGGLQTAGAHCDTMNGPVVTAAKTALETGDVNRVLIWVRHTDEQEVKELFAKTRAVRGLGAGAKEIADRHFFETVVRLHRAGEGMAYTGLKESGVEEPGIAAADRALEAGSDDPLIRELSDAVKRGVAEKYADVRKHKAYRTEDVEAGRGYVRSYVEFIHYVEGIHRALTAAAQEGNAGAGSEVH